jgi:hypothetical protein
LEAVSGSQLFWQTWNRQRADLPDQSQSGYDLSLATLAALHGWSDQEAANLIIAARRLHNEKPQKALRDDYIRRTLARARQAAAVEDSNAEPVDLSVMLGSPDADSEPEEEPGPEDPGAIPDEMFRIPGFVGELMDFCLEISPYPNPAMAFCGAMALQSFLCGRKVREPGDLRTNLYLLALAGASTGKDHPRKINSHVLHRIGRIECLGDKFASGEGIQDAIFINPCMLFQNDEIDGVLQAINRGRDGYARARGGTEVFEVLPR